MAPEGEVSFAVVYRNHRRLAPWARAGLVKHIRPRELKQLLPVRAVWSCDHAQNSLPAGIHPVQRN